MRLAERVANGLQEVNIEDDSEPERKMLGGLKRQGKKGTVGTKRTGNATLCEYTMSFILSSILIFHSSFLC